MNESPVQLDFAGATFAITSLSLPAGTTLEEWAEIGRKLNRAEQSLLWWMADWAALGDAQFEKVKDFCESNRISYSMIRRLAAVSAGVAPKVRNPNVSIWHHEEVVGKPEKEQKALLKQAEMDGMSASDLRAMNRMNGAEYLPEKVGCAGPVILDLEKVFLDCTALCIRHRPVLSEKRDFMWKRAAPIAKMLSEIWPDKVRVQ